MSRRLNAIQAAWCVASHCVRLGVGGGGGRAAAEQRRVGGRWLMSRASRCCPRLGRCSATQAGTVLTCGLPAAEQGGHDLGPIACSGRPSHHRHVTETGSCTAHMLPCAACHNKWQNKLHEWRTMNNKTAGPPPFSLASYHNHVRNAASSAVARPAMHVYAWVLTAAALEPSSSSASRRLPIWRPANEPACLKAPPLHTRTASLRSVTRLGEVHGSWHDIK